MITAIVPYASNIPSVISANSVAPDAPLGGPDIHRELPGEPRSNLTAPTRVPSIVPLRAAATGDTRFLARQAFDEVIAWSHADRFILERNECSRWHQVDEALRTERVVSARTGGLVPAGELPEEAHRFVLKHNWSGAFANAEGLNNDFKLPFEKCAFELRISRRTVIVLVEEYPEHIAAYCFIEAGDFWVASGGIGSSTSDFGGFIWAQIRAVCVALDAGVATHSTVAAPHRLNRKRALRGRLPVRDYHVVDLARRHRRVRQLTHRQSGIRLRLHFRRGHWRVLASGQKVWVRWCLVGDPDLGFIDTEYAI